MGEGGGSDGGQHGAGQQVAGQGRTDTMALGHGRYLEGCKTARCRARSARQGRDGPVRGGRGEAGSGEPMQPLRRSQRAVDQASGGAWPRCWRRPGASVQGMSGAANGQCERAPDGADAEGTRSSSVRSQWLASSSGGAGLSVDLAGAEAQRRSLAGASSCRGPSPPRSSSGCCSAWAAAPWVAGSSGRVPSNSVNIATHASRLASAGRRPRMAVPSCTSRSGRGRNGRRKRKSLAGRNIRRQRGVIVMRPVSRCK
ncbi:hypothetical protein D3C72_1020710 [compost metagenome]